MSIFCPTPKEMIGTTFTHYGWAFGLIPVYVGGLEDENGELEITVRDWMPEWPLDFVEWAFFSLCTLLSAACEPVILITGEIEVSE